MVEGAGVGDEPVPAGPAHGGRARQLVLRAGRVRREPTGERLLRVQLRHVAVVSELLIVLGFFFFLQRSTQTSEGQERKK